ncbi:hypothetical protein FKW77_006626 [Venturia effusa]|uniref:Uncharacterized protein n=1 Tax=Venturia effusa TaxID=50376 RepID=A0A517L3J0_9PEZI|nr:hypothetical protein FKW77_006626 [Venturia effusa]
MGVWNCVAELNPSSAMRMASMISGCGLQTHLLTCNVGVEVATPSLRLVFGQAPAPGMIAKECRISWNCIGPKQVRNLTAILGRQTFALTRTGASRKPEEGHILVQYGMQEMCGTATWLCDQDGRARTDGTKRRMFVLLMIGTSVLFLKERTREAFQERS